MIEEVNIHQYHDNSAFDSQLRKDKDKEAYKSAKHSFIKNG